ncbi:MAG TPA: ATP-binding cassette domain-containing protein [Candidatus Sulfotelmatobacter sp.]|nr:ATP-binding cassette domain-containing protein [Candidatus Sulfotelmatobacter sp.]
MSPASGTAPEKIRVRGVRKLFQQKQGGRVTEAIRDLSFSVAEGEYLAIVGETGAGKSVFFDCLLGLKDVSAGEILIDGTPAERFRRNRVGKMTRIFQEDRLLPWRTATDNAAMGLEIQGVATARRVETAQRWLHAVGLAGFEQAFPNELSGGMRQRVNIARAFATGPDILLMDEAFSGLDEVTSMRLRQDFLALAHQQRMTFLMITHSIDEALVLGSRILVFGAPAQVVHEVRVPPGAAHDQAWVDATKADIKRWISEHGRMMRNAD